MKSFLLDPFMLLNPDAAQAAWNGDMGDPEPVATTPKRRPLGPSLPSHPAVRQGHRRDVYVHVDGGDDNVKKAAASPRPLQNRLAGGEFHDIRADLVTALGSLRELHDIIIAMAQRNIDFAKKALVDETYKTPYDKSCNAFDEIKKAEHALSRGEEKIVFFYLILAAILCDDDALRNRIFALAEKFKPKLSPREATDLWNNQQGELRREIRDGNSGSIFHAAAHFIDDPKISHVPRIFEAIRGLKLGVTEILAVSLFFEVIVEAWTEKLGSAHTTEAAPRARPLPNPTSPQTQPRSRSQTPRSKLRPVRTPAPVEIKPPKSPPLTPTGQFSDIEIKIRADITDPKQQAKCIEYVKQARSQPSNAKNTLKALLAYIRTNEPFAYALMGMIEGNLTGK